MDYVLNMKMYGVLLSVIVLMHLVDVVISVGSSTRYYANGTSVTCQGVICPLDKIFVPCTHSLGDRRHDTCEPCPSDRPRTLNTFDSSAFEDPPVFFVCKSVLERCKCAEEAELVNPLECAKTLFPNCSCNITSGYYGLDPKACHLSENKQCKLPGYELKQDGNCEECPRDTYKSTHQFGRCLPQPRCQRPLVVDDPGDRAHRRTCQLPLTRPPVEAPPDRRSTSTTPPVEAPPDRKSTSTTPPVEAPPDRRSTSRESTSATGIEYSTLSYSTFNVTASTNQTSPLLDSTNFEWIYMYLVPVVADVLLIVGVFICVIRKKERKRKKWQQDKRHKKNEDCDGLIENGMGNNNTLNSVNKYQQGNSGDSHKSSCVFEMFKMKTYTKTCGSSKGYEQVKTTTMNEEKNTVDGDQTPAKVNGDQTSAKVNDDQTSNIVYVDEIKEEVNSNGITDKENSDEIADNMDVYGTFVKMFGDETVKEVNGDKTGAKINGDETDAKINGDETDAKINGDETDAKINGHETDAKISGDETDAKINGDDHETVEMVNADETVEMVNGEEMTEIENCENISTKSYTTENHDTSYGRLDVNSLFSAAKTSSGFVNDMYILKWSPRDDSSSQGFIECTDPSGNQFKSMTINNGSQGMILLKMKEITKRCNFIFVSFSENCQTESFVQIIVEPVTRNLDLSTLLKSGLSTIDFRSFEDEN